MEGLCQGSAWPESEFISWVEYMISQMKVKPYTWANKSQSSPK